MIFYAEIQGLGVLAVIDGVGSINDTETEVEVCNL